MPEPACPVCDADGVMPCDTPNGDPHPERAAVDRRLADPPPTPEGKVRCDGRLSIKAADHGRAPCGGRNYHAPHDYWPAPAPFPTPTPAPDTLRAAIEALCDEWNRWQGEMAPHSITASTLRGCVTDVRAALAASPAPTDSPRSVLELLHEHRVVMADGVEQRVVGILLERKGFGRGVWSSTVADDETAFPVVRPWAGSEYPRSAAVGVCTYDAAPHAMFDDCADWRPAAVTAPREDERAQAAKVIRTWWSRHPHSTDPDWNAQNLAIDLDNAGLLAAAAPAVERATPDPATLAAILAKADGYPPPATAPAHYDQARALIAAWATLNETST